MKNISTFQIAFLAFFVLIAIVGIAVFASFGGSTKAAVPKATIWGTLSGQYVNDVVRNINISSTVIDVTYVEKDPATFESEFVNALAEGNGPDAVLLSDDMLYSQRNKLQLIPFTLFNERDYRSTFIDGASLFVTKDGLLGVPFSVDPMVMYFNKNILAQNAVSRPPLNWSEMSQIGPTLIKKTDTSTITQALVPFGEYANVRNAKEILATLLFQTGNPITALNAQSGSIYSTLDQDNAIPSQQSSDVTKPDEQAQSAIDFYTSFANPSKALYTWNRSLPNSLDLFLAGKLAFYFGYASEISRIQQKNPNLNFDVAQIPQEEGGYPNIYGKISAFAIVKQTKNANGALGVIFKLTDKESIGYWRDSSNLPPVRTDLLAQAAPNAFMTVFYRAAIQAKSWFDPSPASSDIIFRDMIESITSGKSKLSNAIGDAKQKLDELLKDK